MAFFPGNFICKTAVQYQYRVFLIPWLNCSNGRDYNASVPVRYIPKKSSKCEDSKATSLPAKHLKHREKLDTVSELNVQRVEFSNNSHRSFVLNPKTLQHDRSPIGNMHCGVELENEEEIEGNFGDLGCELMEEPLEVSEELKVNHGKDPGKKIMGIRAGKSKEEAEKLAIGLLATRAFTAMEMKKKLLGKGFPLDSVDSVVTDFQSRGLLDDCLYAETFCRSRWSSSSWGPRRIKQALLKKGVKEIVAEKAIKLVFVGGESGLDQDSRIGMSQASIDRLCHQASKQWLRSRDVPLETRKSRIVRWLQYRGFNWNVVAIVLKKLESEHLS
ncbi:uncharacterized protein LOC111402496 isoform X2 [Olea europaea var. sylvestris]|uniref:uncharacterized protein LOC111402496 isoform X2 n=1 Tax=Olea europaea var. sylvestris TaxID=158386 RepID=UPI000C1D7036|nr:uncharacterized protein LOC111402496 isoform X2 [Olea europaea var. sylvestris]